MAAGPLQSNVSEKTTEKGGMVIVFFFSQGTWTFGTEVDKKTLLLAVFRL